jgi:hypothetical protein
MGDSFPLSRGRHHFFPKRSFSDPAELGFPFVDARVADAMLAAQIGDRNPRLVLLQNPDDLEVSEAKRPSG